MRLATSLLFLLLVSFSYAADDGTNFSEEAWEDLTEELDYTEPPKEEPKPMPEPVNWEGPSSLFSGAKYLFASIIGLALLVLIVYMIASSKSNPALNARKAALEKIENIEERIHEVDLEDLFSEFSNNGEYHIALRMSFLMIIKRLSEVKLIKWEKQKTNWEYHSELGKEELRDDFATMISTFERLWYGEKQILEPEFHQIEEEFNTFKRHLDGQV